DVRGQAHRLRELAVDVDRVEVARRAGVAVRHVLVGRHPQLLDLVALVHERHPPRTMLVHVPRTTSAPSWLRDTDSNTKNCLPSLSDRSFHSTSVVIASPAHTGSSQANSCEPCSMRAKSMPTSGSKIAGPMAPA